MSAKKDQATEAVAYCYLMQLFKWEPVVYSNFEVAHFLMREYLDLEDCVPNLTAKQITELLDQYRECTVEGKRYGQPTEVKIKFQKFAYVGSKVKS